MSNGRRMWVGAAVVAGIAAIIAVVLITTDSDEDAAPPPSASTSSPAPGATEPPLDVATAVWPDATTGTRYSDPVEAARGFASDYVRFTNPIAGEFRQGDARSGEVEVQPFDGGPVTTVFVRQLGTDDSWWVLGTATASIEVTAPATLARVSSPVTLAGTSTAFEGTIQVEVRADGSAEPLGRGFVTGGANGEMGPFHSELDFESPETDSGAIIFFTVSAEDGSVVEAAVTRVFFT